MRSAKYRDDSGALLTYEQTAKKSNLGIALVMKVAREAGALIKIGKQLRVNWEKFYDYLLKMYQEDQNV